MLFLFKTKKIVLDAFTSSEEIYKLYPLSKAITSLPKWIKDYPNVLYGQNSFGVKFPQRSIKHCPGIIETLKKSIAIPLWADIALRFGERFDDWGYHASDLTIIDNHQEQLFSNKFPNYFQLKIVSPWFLLEKTDCPMLLHEAFYHNLDNQNSFSVMPGVIRNKSNNSCNINILSNKKNCQVFLKSGSTVAYLTPITDFSFEVRNHLIDDSELQNLIKKSRRVSSFMGSYKKFVNFTTKRKIFNDC